MAKRLTTEEFVAKSRSIHGDRYDYSKVSYAGMHKHVVITCLEHGEFNQKPIYHTLRKAGCPECAKWICPSDSFEDFVAKATAIHGHKYKYNPLEYTSSTVKMVIMCPEHGKFTQLPFAHVHGQGCPKCGLLTNANARRKTVEEYVAQARLVHGAEYDYSLVVYTTTHANIEVICPDHGSFFPRAGDHLNGSKCPRCSTNKLHSAKSIEWLNYISERDGISIQHAENVGEFRIPGTRLKVDGYCETTNTVYEFHGDLWHGNPNRFDPSDVNPVTGKTFGELYERTKQREEIIIALGYNLVTLWESDWNEMKKVIC